MNAGSPLPWGIYPSPQMYDATPPSSPRGADLVQREQPLMYGYAPRLPSARARRAATVPLAQAIFGILALLLIGGVALAAIALKRPPKSIVVFVNGTDAAVDLVIDGKSRGEIRAGKSLAV